MAHKQSGYQSFPAAPAPPAPCTAVAAATIPTVTPITTGYPRQPLATAALPQHPHNGTFHPSALPPVSQIHNSPTVPHLRASYPQQQNNRGPSPSVYGSQKFRPGFNRSLLGFHPKGLKRKADDTLSTDSGDSGNGKSEGSTASGELFIYPLYCKVCRVTLNAPAQAKQHYEGKSHAKKVKLTDSGNNTLNGTSTSGSSCSAKGCMTSTHNSLDQSPASPKEAPLPPPEINPEIYCKLCGVSFNSNKQAQQHYQGKNHAKKTRVTDGDKSRTGHRRGSRYRCYLCNLHLASKQHLLIHLRGPQHQDKLKAQRTQNRDYWPQKHGDVPNGVPFGVTQFSHGAAVGHSHHYNKDYHPDTGHTAESKAPDRLSMYRTPSGNYYCPSCNVTVSSDSLLMQHMQSRKHKIMNGTQQRRIQTKSNNNSTTSNQETS